MSRPEQMVLTVGLLALAGCGTPAPTVAQVHRSFADLPVLSQAAVVFDPPDQTRAAMVTSVTASVSINKARGGHQIWADFHAPDGTSYQRSVNGVQEVWTETPLSFTLPVSGTVIDANTLVGTWTVQYLVDGVALTSLSFNLEP